MRRKIAIAFIVLTALLQGADAKPVHRIELAPGYSVAVPDGFASCDAATNKTLGNAPHLIVLRQLCTISATHKNSMVLVSLDPAAPVTVSSLPLHNLPVTAATFDQVDQGALDIVKASFCTEMLKAYRLDTCALRKGSVAGVPAFAGDAAGVNSQGMRLTIRAYLLPGAPDGLAMVFFLKDPMPAKSTSASEAIAASLRVAPVPAPAPAPPVTLTVAPGVTFQVPKDWSACDAASAAQLSAASADETARFCTTATSLRVFHPRAPYYESVGFQYTAAQHKTDPAEIARIVDPDHLAKEHDGICRNVTGPLIGKGVAVASCDIEAGTVAGHPAAIVTFTGSRLLGDGAGSTRVKGSSTEIPLVDGTVEIMLSCESAIPAEITPEIDAIVQSLTIP